MGKHEQFAVGTAVQAELLTSTALRHVLPFVPNGEAAAETPAERIADDQRSRDPVFALIEAEKKAFDVSETGSSAGWNGSREDAHEAWNDAQEALFAVAPTTMAGCAAQREALWNSGFTYHGTAPRSDDDLEVKLLQSMIEAWKGIGATDGPDGGARTVGERAFARERASCHHDREENGYFATPPDMLGAIRDGMAMLSEGVREVAMPCKAARIGCLIGRLGTEIHALGTAGGDDSVPGPLKGPSLRMLHANAELEAMRDAVSFTRARSPGGMLAQLAVACDQLGMGLEGTHEEDRRKAHDRAERCLYSVAAALCAMTALDRESFGAGYLFTGRFDRLAILDTVEA